MKYLLIAFAVTVSFTVHAGSGSRGAQVSAGTLEVVEDFKSEFVAARDIYVWLPEGYSADRKYAVLYMHDAQMLFDASVTWNKKEWGVDEVAQAAMTAGGVRDFIVVGANNGAELRHREYFPEAVYRMMPKAQQESLYGYESDKLLADEYLKFLVTELKPYIDAHYSTHTDMQNTAVAGSSMGGLISMYAVSEYPEVFGAAACLSTHWPGIDPEKMGTVPELFLAYMREKLPKPGRHKIYFDYGDQTLDAYYPPLQAKVDQLMQELGYGASDWLTVYDPGAEHDEIAWQKRMPGILEFLFAK